MLRWCSPANHPALSRPGLGFESRTERILIFGGKLTIIDCEEKYEKIVKKMEEERPNEMEMAKKAYEQRKKETKGKEIVLIQ